MTAITFPNNPNTDPGVGGRYTAQNGLIYVWDGEKWESLGTNNADPNNFVAVSGDNMTGPLTIGPEGGTPVTTLGDDGSAEFAGRIDCAGIAADGNSRIYNQISNPAASLFTCNSNVGGTNQGKFTVLAGGATTIAGTVTTPGVVFGDIPDPQPDNRVVSSKTLSDYEEGGWTPAPQNYTDDLTVQSARYIKIGRLVHLQAYFTFGTTSNANQIIIAGIPFPAANGNGNYSLLTAMTNGSLEGFTMRPQPYTETIVACDRVGENGDHKPTYANLSGQFIIMAGTYITN